MSIEIGDPREETHQKEDKDNKEERQGEILDFTLGKENSDDSSMIKLEARVAALELRVENVDNCFSNENLEILKRCLIEISKREIVNSDKSKRQRVNQETLIERVLERVMLKNTLILGELVEELSRKREVEFQQVDIEDRNKYTNENRRFIGGYNKPFLNQQHCHNNNRKWYPRDQSKQQYNHYAGTLEKYIPDYHVDDRFGLHSYIRDRGATGNIPIQERLKNMSRGSFSGNFLGKQC